MNLGFIDFVWTVVAGGTVGCLSGLFGVGGGFLLVPVLNIFLHIPIEFAVGAGACQVLGPATTSLLSRRFQVGDLRLPLVLAGGLMIGVVAGASMLEQLSSKAFDESRWLQSPDVVVLVVYFFVLSTIGLFAIWDVHREHAGRPMPRGLLSRWRIPPLMSCKDNGRVLWLSIPILAWFGLFVGFLSGLLGMSGGLVLLPGLIYLIGIRTHAAVLNTLVIVWIVSATATVTYAWHDYIRLELVVALLLGGTFGARIGSELSGRLKGPQLRKGFGWLLLTAAAVVAGKLSILLNGYLK